MPQQRARRSAAALMSPLQTSHAHGAHAITAPAGMAGDFLRDTGTSASANAGAGASLNVRYHSSSLSLATPNMTTTNAHLHYMGGTSTEMAMGPGMGTGGAGMARMLLPHTVEELRKVDVRAPSRGSPLHASDAILQSIWPTDAPWNGATSRSSTTIHHHHHGHGRIGRGRGHGGARAATEKADPFTFNNPVLRRL